MQAPKFWTLEPPRSVQHLPGETAAPTDWRIPLCRFPSQALSRASAPFTGRHTLSTGSSRPNTIHRLPDGPRVTDLTKFNVVWSLCFQLASRNVYVLEQRSVFESEDLDRPSSETERGSILETNQRPIRLIATTDFTVLSGRGALAPGIYQDDRSTSTIIGCVH